MLEQLTHVNLRSVGMLKDALADRCVELLAWALAERDRADTAERELKQWREWDDADDEWSAATAEAFPTRSGSHEAYATAMAMVSHRQSKGNLVELVNWLLVRITAAETREREAVASRDGQWRDALIAKGTAAESWAEHGPQNPDEAAIFRAEYDRVDGEYRAASVAKARADAFAEVVAWLRVRRSPKPRPSGRGFTRGRGACLGSPTASKSSARRERGDGSTRIYGNRRHLGQCLHPREGSVEEARDRTREHGALCARTLPPVYWRR